MKKYAKVVNEETKLCQVGLSNNSKFYQSIGMKEQDVEQAYNGNWYIKGYAPEKPVEELQAEVRAVRNSYLETYVDPKQLVMVWDGLSEDERQLYADYRTYLLDYTELEGWYLNNPMTLDEWEETNSSNSMLPEAVESEEQSIYEESVSESPSSPEEEKS